MLDHNTEVDRHLLEQFTTDLHDLLARRNEVRETLDRIMSDPFELANYDLLNDLRILEHLGRCIAGGIDRVSKAELPAKETVAEQALVEV